MEAGFHKTTRSLKKGGDKYGPIFFSRQRNKKEYFSAWDIGGSGKLYEWCVNRQAGVLPYLLRMSDGASGSGDIFDVVEDPQFAGRWAGDEVYLAGDCDSEELHQIAQEVYTNISEGLVSEYNLFVEKKEHQLLYVPNSS